MSRFFRGSAGARGGVDLLYVVEPRLLWSSFCPRPGVCAQRLPITLTGSWIEPWLLAVRPACGPGCGSDSLPRGYPISATDLPQYPLEFGSFVGFFVAGYVDMVPGP